MNTVEHRGCWEEGEQLTKDDRTQGLRKQMLDRWSLAIDLSWEEGKSKPEKDKSDQLRNVDFNPQGMEQLQIQTVSLGWWR